MALKGEVGFHALNSHGIFIVDHGKIMDLLLLNFCGNPDTCKIDLSRYSSKTVIIDSSDKLFFRSIEIRSVAMDMKSR